MKQEQELILNHKNSSVNATVLRIVSKNYLLIFLVLLIAIASFLSSMFLTVNNLVNVLVQNSVISVLALGQLLVIITAGIDLSVGSVVAVASVLSAQFLGSGMNPILVIVVVMLLMAVAGVGNGLAVAYGKITPFVVTLATLTIYRGLAYMFQVGSLIQIDNDTFLGILAGSIGPIYSPLIILLITLGVILFVLRSTTFGRRLYAIGGNPEAARLSGASINRDIIVAYALCGMLAGLAGLMTTARLGTGSALYGQGYELDSIAAVVVGGASLMGGKGSAVNTILGAFLIGIIRNILNLMGVPSYPQMVIQGLIILVAVLSVTVRRKK
ncbi:ribose ABC transporter permease [Aneurinibacillus sp. Ricciae_BoGa-3]|uniref:ABC transporter permease n=1 Tax=Aneurinibacillus sp. Ricciae_BoGa-3 TaxID=3022697 RepID=UPI00233FC3F2|nr:ribose ABC transporter permease [Aneurinibacillus sp. Ricciae_BoGa-3]WCK53203.1 ribose ABC transporter permease [Aneurinibacillus sp. Ricciae_BoGa-3]